MGIFGRSLTRVLATAAVAAAALLGAACEFSLGRSVEGRDIPVHAIGSGDKYVVLIGGLHTGDEDNSRIIAEQMVTYLRAYPYLVPSSVTVLIVPSVNPDGTALGLHTNARGVDLNRNWPTDDWFWDACHPSTGCRSGLGGPAPLSEPETAALYQFVQLVRPEVTLVWHAHGQLIESNEVPGAEEYARAFGDAAGYAYLDEWTAYEITGQLIDALEQRLNLRAMDVELAHCCEITPEEFDRNARGLIALLNAVHAGPAPRVSPTPSSTPTEKPKVPTFNKPMPTRTPRPD